MMNTCTPTFPTDPKEDEFIELGDGTFWYPGRDDNTFNVDTLARSVAKLCRFTGHTSNFYSVAEHLVKCSYAVAPEFALEALVHDLHEALTNDLSRPVKRYIGGSYHELEVKAEEELRRFLGLPEKMSPEVKEVDTAMCLIEAKYLMPSQGKHWTYYNQYKPMADAMEKDQPYLTPHCWSWRHATVRFLDRYDELTDGR